VKVSGAGLTEAGVPPLTLVSPGTPSEPSASPAAETLGGRQAGGVEGHAASECSSKRAHEGGRGFVGIKRAQSPSFVELAPPAYINARTSADVPRGGNPTGQASPETLTEAGIKPGPACLAPDAEPLPARPHGGPEDQAGAAAPACRCGHDAWEHTWRCHAQLAPDEWCDCIEWREVEPECVCHSGSVCSPACAMGRCHTGCK
jgi:hypothetical protein